MKKRTTKTVEKWESELQVYDNYVICLCILIKEYVPCKDNLGKYKISPLILCVLFPSRREKQEGYELYLNSCVDGCRL